MLSRTLNIGNISETNKD